VSVLSDPVSAVASRVRSDASSPGLPDRQNRWPMLDAHARGLSAELAPLLASIPGQNYDDD
jgi:hypothetical protein